MGTIVPSSAALGRVRRLGTCLILSAAVLAPVAWAQTDPPKTTLPTSIELPRLLDLAAERLHVRVEYVPSVLSGTATLRGDLSDEELWGVVNSRLADAGFTTIRGAVPSQFKVVKLESGLGGSAPLEPVRWVTQSLPHAQPPRTGQQIDWPPGPRPGYASTVVELRNRTAKEVAESIRPLLSKSGGVTVVPGSADRVILSDLTPKLEELLGLLPLVDAPSDASVIEEIPLKGASASALVASVKDLAAKRELIVGENTPSGPRSAGEILASPGGRSVLLIAPKQTLGFWRDLVGRLDTQASLETREYTPRVFAIKDVASLVTDLLKGKAEDQLRIVPDELTGTLIVTATPEQHERIAALMTRLDATPSEATSRLRSFAIRNRPVKDVAEALNTLLGAGDIEFNGASPSRGPLMPGVPGNAAVLPSRQSEWTQPVVLAPASGSEATPGEGVQTPPVDAAAYRVALWVPPPPPPAEPAKPQPIALNLQLLGIHHERSGDHDILRATLYDPATDRIHIVADGDKLGVFTIASVNAKGVDVSDGTLVRTLALDSGGKALPARPGKEGTR